MKFIYNTLFIFCFCSLFSQAPGYLGKRLVLGYGAHFSPALINANANNATFFGKAGGSAETGNFAFNYTHEGFIEYATSSKFMIGFSGKFYKTNYDNALDLNSYDYNNSNIAYEQAVQGHYQISGQSLCLYGKFYGSRYVAPWGRYIILGPVINLYSTTYDPSMMYQKGTYYDYNSNTNVPTTISNYGALNQSFTGFNILFGWGRTRIIANRITLDYGVNMQVVSLFTSLADNLTELQSTVKSIDYIEKTSGKRIRGINRINAFIKVGFLIF